MIKFELLPHQIADSEDMAQGDCPNFSEAGTGKTHSTLEAIKKSKVQGGTVVCPPIALVMWQQELTSYLGASAQILKTGASPIKGETDFVVVPYTLAHAQQGNICEWASKFNHDNVLVCDESQYIKTPSAKRSKAIMGHAGVGRGGIFDSAGVYWPLSGTPIEKYPDDLWMQLRAAWGEEFRKYGVETYEQFVRRFCVVTKKQFHPRSQPRWVPSAAQNERLLNKLLYEDIKAIRRRFDDVKADMPPLTFRDVFIKLPHDRAFAPFEKLSTEDVEEEDAVMSEALHLLSVYKAHEAIDYIQELNKQVVIGYWHSKAGDILEEKLREYGSVARVRGGMSLDSKERIRQGFNSGSTQFLIGQYATMKTAWNLQESGSHVVLLEDNFSPSVIEQFIKRVWRMGQGSHVQVDFIRSQYKLDSIVKSVRERKAESNNRIIG